MPTLKVILLGGMQEPGHGAAGAGSPTRTGSTSSGPGSPTWLSGPDGTSAAGHAFSRAQIAIALEVLLRRFPALALDPDRLPVFRGWEFRAPRNLDVLLHGS